MNGHVLGDEVVKSVDGQVVDVVLAAGSIDKISSQ